MKRYDHSAFLGSDGSAWPEEVPIDDGEWVRYDDYVAQIEALRALADKWERWAESWGNADGSATSAYRICARELRAVLDGQETR